MTTAKKHGVLVGVDGSEEARSALAWGLREAQQRGVPLTALGAWLPLTPVGTGAVPQHQDVEAREDAVQAFVDEAIRSLGDTGGVDVRREVVMAPAAAALLDRAGEADLIVIGSRGLGGFGDLLLGSVSRQVASHAACSVVVIRPTEDDEPAGDEAGRVVVGVDTSTTAAGALEYAFRFASARGIGLTAVHTWEPPLIDGTMLAAPTAAVFDDVADEEVRATAAVLAHWRAEFPEVDVRQRVIAGRPAPVLVELSRGAELLVVGSRGRGGFVGLLLGSVSHSVLHHASCPVAVARTDA